MTIKRTPRPRDPVQLSKLMVDIMTGQEPDTVDDGKDKAAVELGREGGVLGGKVRATTASLPAASANTAPANASGSTCAGSKAVPTLLTSAPATPSAPTSRCGWDRGGSPG